MVDLLVDLLVFYLVVLWVYWMVDEWVDWWDHRKADLSVDKLDDSPVVPWVDTLVELMVV
jgi:hypothetical protein